MAKRQKVWARRALDALRHAMGGECARCPEDGDLEFDCIAPQGGEHHRFSTDQLATFYRRQHAEGNLQLLCPACHSDKSYWEHPFRRTRSAVPEFHFAGEVPF